jgi:hypothetical protein
MRRECATLSTIVCASLALLAAGCNPQPSLEERAFLAQRGQASITVYPTIVREGRELRYDTASAPTLADFLRDNGYVASAVVTTVEPTVRRETPRFQHAFWKQTRADFEAFVRGQTLETDYAVVVELLKGGPDAPAGGVHCFVVARAGGQPFGFLLNDHHATFAAAPRKTPADCVAIMCNVIKAEW